MSVREVNPGQIAQELPDDFFVRPLVQIYVHSDVQLECSTFSAEPFQLSTLADILAGFRSILDKHDSRPRENWLLSVARPENTNNTITKKGVFVNCHSWQFWQLLHTCQAIDTTATLNAYTYYLSGRVITPLPMCGFLSFGMNVVSNSLQRTMYHNQEWDCEYGPKGSRSPAGTLVLAYGSGGEVHLVREEQPNRHLGECSRGLRRKKKRLLLAVVHIVGSWYE